MKWENNRHQGAVNPAALAVDVAKLNRAEHLYISRQKALCWKCQKDVPKSLGKFSFLIRRTGGRLNAENNQMKFICFACKPEEKNNELL
tara:strand:- start:67 stop:333 length:267 start_codon:yes stop_codon:yes gene_type:complete